MLALRQVNGVNFQVGHGPEILCKLHPLCRTQKLKPYFWTYCVHSWKNKYFEPHHDNVNVIYYIDAASGGAFDYFKLNGVKYCYVYELRPSSGSGTDGFILPASQIDPSIRETFASFYSFADQIPA